MAHAVSLLTPARNNPKTAKHLDDLRIESAVLHLAPANRSGHEVCPFRSLGCSAACLNTAGRGAMQATQDARVRRTNRLFDDRDGFMTQLADDIDALQRRATAKGYRAAVRLNGTSDLLWEIMPLTWRGQTYRNLMAAFPEVQFYDYTKVIPRLRRPLPGNYHLTFSLSESNDAHALDALARGFSVAAVIAGPVPERLWGYRTVDGDAHDYRFLDADGEPVIVVLRAKGQAKTDTSGFVRTATDTLDASRRPTLARLAA